MNFEKLIQKRTLNVIYQKFSERSFTIQEAISQLYWLGCIEEHVLYMQERGWIQLTDNGLMFVIKIENWTSGGIPDES